MSHSQEIVCPILRNLNRLHVWYVYSEHWYFAVDMAGRGSIESSQINEIHIHYSAEMMYSFGPSCIMHHCGRAGEQAGGKRCLSGDATTALQYILVPLFRALKTQSPIV